jgi:hypothetical protein
MLRDAKMLIVEPKQRPIEESSSVVSEIHPLRQKMQETLA